MSLRDAYLDLRDECPCCGAQLVLGIWLPAVKADILRKVMRAGDAGYCSGDWMSERNATRSAFKVHVHHINAALAATDWRVRGTRGQPRGGGGVYRLVRAVDVIP